MFIQYIPTHFIFLKTTLYENCTHLDDVVQIVRNADGKNYNTDSHRYSQFDDHEEQHSQATADADHVVHEAGENCQATEEGCHCIAIKDTSIRDIVEYEVEPVADNEEYSVSHQTQESLTKSPCPILLNTVVFVVVIIVVLSLKLINVN